MKNTRLFLLIMGGLFTIALFNSNSSGRANNRTPRTGAPSGGGTGTEGTCNQCHSSGFETYGLPQMDWTIADGEGNNITTYVPGQTYNVTVAVTTPMGSPAAYGFSSVFLDDTEAPNGPTAAIAGTFSNLSSFTRMSDPSDSDRVYIEHNDRTPSGVWTFDWTAPAAGFGEVRIYSTANAVNSNFSTSGDSGSNAPTIITLQEAATLPVTLSAFTAEAVKNTVHLDWETSLEENVSHFSVERSFNQGPFVSVTEQRAKANSGATYQAEDTNLAAGNYAYRLRMEDLDATFAYGPTVAVAVEAEETLAVYPNPSNGPLTISTGGLISQLRLLDGNGRVVQDNLTPGQQNFADLVSGVYLLEAISTNGRTVKRVVIR